MVSIKTRFKIPAHIVYTTTRIFNYLLCGKILQQTKTKAENCLFNNFSCPVAKTGTNFATVLEQRYLYNTMQPQKCNAPGSSGILTILGLYFLPLLYSLVCVLKNTETV